MFDVGLLFLIALTAIDRNQVNVNDYQYSELGLYTGRSCLVLSLMSNLS